MKNIAETISQLSQAEMRGFYFSVPAVIVGIQNLADGLIDVKIPIDKFVPSTAGYVEHPTIYDVPIRFPSTSKTSIVFPVEQGDGVHLVFSQYDLFNYLHGMKDNHEPLSNLFLSMDNAVAYVGLNPILESPLNPNNYSTDFDPTALNIVHNKKTENEASISIKQDASINFNTKGNVTINCATANVKAEESVILDTPKVDATNAIVETQNDVVVRGISFFNFATQHRHKYTDDGNLMETFPPNPQG